MKILYAAVLTENDSSLYRMWALQRAGHELVSFNSMEYVPKNTLMLQLAYRLSAGPWVQQMNRDLIRLAEATQPDVLWADKMLWMQPRTLKRMRMLDIFTVSYMIDNPFGTRGDPGWRLYLKGIPYYDLHVVQREKNIAEYAERGARSVIKIQTAYEPTIHYPPPEKWNDKHRDREVSFIGTPYDQRDEFLTRLWKEFGIPVTISGGMVWKEKLSKDASSAMYRGQGELFRDSYREGIWKSKINLSFLTHSNQDEFAHKSFEIAACGGFLLAERSPGHSQRFIEDKEAVFFSSIEECAKKIWRYLPDEAAREQIAAAGWERAARDGYHNDRQVALVVESVGEILAKRRSY